MGAIMKHAGVEFEVQKLPNNGGSKFHWIIYPKKEQASKVIGQDYFSTSEDAQNACIAEIDLGLSSATNA
jgi:hypothetical protein